MDDFTAPELGSVAMARVLYVRPDVALLVSGLSGLTDSGLHMT